MTKSQKKSLIRIIVAAVLAAVVYFIPATGWLRLILFLIPYLAVGYEALYKAGRNILHGQIFDENFLMSIATIGAFAIGDYLEAVGVMLFYQIGELFESIAVGKSRNAISSLMDMSPEYANVEKDGELVQVDPYDVSVGDTIVIKPGEKIPLDGIVKEGASTLNTSALTGESMPRDVAVGDRIVSGCINMQGLLKAEVTSAYEDSTVAKILELIESSSNNKAASESLVTRIAKYYTPAVVAGAVALAVIPSIITGNFTEWLHRALTFLVISCPCAFVISVPLSFFAGIGGASKKGILVKGSNYLENLAKAQIVVFDKTGTLTQGVFNVTGIYPDGIEKDALLEIAAYAEGFADHPIALSLKKAYSKQIDTERIGNVTNYAGEGVSAEIDGKAVYIGNAKLMKRIGVGHTEPPAIGTVVYVASGGKFLGSIVISDEIKPDAESAVARLKQEGIEKSVMLTGDRKAVAENIAGRLGLDEYRAELMPADKVNEVVALKKELHKGRKLIYVGDGVNDVPVLVNADVGISMGALGSDAAIEAADIVIMDDKPSKIADAIDVSRKTNRIVKENIIFAFGVKILILILGALGISGMWAAVFADVGVTVVAVLNAMRALRQ